MAENKADALEAAAATRAFKKHMAWLQEGPSNGIGRQHKLSRTATRWIPNRLAPVDDENVYDDVEGLTAEEQAQLMHAAPPADGPCSPMGSHREADEQRTAWGIHWGTGKEREKPQWPKELAALPP